MLIASTCFVSGYGSKSGGHPELRVQGEPLAAGEIRAERVVEVAQAERPAFAARVKPEPRSLVEVQGTVLAQFEFALGEGFAAHRGAHSFGNPGKRLAIRRPGNSDRQLGEPVRNAKIGILAAPDGVFTDRQEVEPGYGQPTSVGGERLLHPLPVGLLAFLPGCFVEGRRTLARTPGPQENEGQQETGAEKNAHRRIVSSPPPRNE